MKFYLECFWDLKDLWIKSNSYQIHLYPPTLNIYSPYRLIRNVKKLVLSFAKVDLKRDVDYSKMIFGQILTLPQAFFFYWLRTKSWLGEWTELQDSLKDKEDPGAIKSLDIDILRLFIDLRQKMLYFLYYSYATFTLCKNSNRPHTTPQKASTYSRKYAFLLLSVQR